MTARLSVVIVAWNTRDILVRCLQALWSGTRASAEVIIVDNGSTDGGPALIESQFGAGTALTLVRNTSNVGFPKAVNQGLRFVTAPYVLLLNPDIVLASGAADRMLALLRTRDDVGAVGPKIHTPDGRVQFQCARRLPRLLEFAADRFGLSGALPRLGLPNRLMTDWDHADSREVECLSGACVMMRTDELNAVGGLIEEMYLEDNELCWSVRKLMGKKVHYLAEAEAIHYHSASYRAIADRAHYLWIVGMLESAYLKFFALHAPRSTVVAARGLDVLSAVLKVPGLIAALAATFWHRATRERVLKAIYRAYARLVAGVTGPRLDSGRGGTPSEDEVGKHRGAQG